MDKTLFNLLNTGTPGATLVVRLLAGLVFFAEGIKKFIFPTEWGIGRFEKIGIIYPNLSAPFVGVVETALWPSADLRTLYPASGVANPGLTLFHCHQNLHMDFGFMRLFEYV